MLLKLLNWINRKSPKCNPSISNALITFKISEIEFSSH